MTLCQKGRFDQKNRIFIPKEIMASAGGLPNCGVYVVHDEGTNEVKLIFNPERKEVPDMKKLP